MDVYVFFFRQSFFSKGAQNQSLASVSSFEHRLVFLIFLHLKKYTVKPLYIGHLSIADTFLGTD